METSLSLGGMLQQQLGRLILKVLTFVDKHRRRGYYHVKGPNRVWSVDGHDKLKEYGFEIYAVTDAYSRFVCMPIGQFDNF